MMETDKLIVALRTESRYKDKATLEIMDLCMLAADKMEELNNFEQSQSARLLAQLAEKDKQLAAAVELIDQVNNMAVGAIECGPYQDGEEAKIFCRIERMTRRGPQEAGEGGG